MINKRLCRVKAAPLFILTTCVFAHGSAYASEVKAQAKKDNRPTSAANVFISTGSDVHACDIHNREDGIEYRGFAGPGSGAKWANVCLASVYEFRILSCCSGE